MAITYEFVVALDEEADFLVRAALLNATIETNTCAVFIYRAVEQVKFNSLAQKEVTFDSLI